MAQSVRQRDVSQKTKFTAGPAGPSPRSSWPPSATFSAPCAPLHPDPEVFDCLWEGIRKPAEIARRLGKEERQIIRARKRLDRRLAEFGRRSDA